MDLLRAFGLLLLASAGVLALLVTLIVGRKALRDRRESYSARRRERLRHALASGAPRSMRRPSGRSAPARRRSTSRSCSRSPTAPRATARRSSAPFAAQAGFLVYFAALNAAYTLLLVLGSGQVSDWVRRRPLRDFRGVSPSPLSLPVTLLVPAYDEEPVIVDSIRSLLASRYREL